MALRRWLSWRLAIGVAAPVGIERYDTTLFSIHMVQHILTSPPPCPSAPCHQLLRVASPRRGPRSCRSSIALW
jgi:hypothetical protein